MSVTTNENGVKSRKHGGVRPLPVQEVEAPEVRAEALDEESEVLVECEVSEETTMEEQDGPKEKADS